MKCSSFLLFSFLLCGVFAIPLDDKKIVLFKSEVDSNKRIAFAQDVASEMRIEGEEIEHHWFADFHAISGKFSENLLKKLSEHEFVRDISSNEMVYLHESCSKQNPAPWGLERLNLKKAPRSYNRTYLHQYDGSGVDAYIVDTGIDISHPDFEGRAVWGANFGTKPDTDTDGHGTHVAGIVGSKTFGVAKKVKLIAVKVGMAIAPLIKAFEWIHKDAKFTKRRALVNLSIGGAPSLPLTQAAETLIREGIPVIASAGNYNKDACGSSPGESPSVLTVGSSNRADKFSPFSNFGKCVKLIAPGQDITSTLPGGKYGEKSGTSMASPFVAGIMALLMQESPTTTASILTKNLLSSSLPTITKVPADTVNIIPKITCDGPQFV